MLPEKASIPCRLGCNPLGLLRFSGRKLIQALVQEKASVPCSLRCNQHGTRENFQISGSYVPAEKRSTPQQQQGVRSRFQLILKLASEVFSRKLRYLDTEISSEDFGHSDLYTKLRGNWTKRSQKMERRFRAKVWKSKFGRKIRPNRRAELRANRRAQLDAQIGAHTRNCSEIRRVAPIWQKWTPRPEK